MVRDFDRKLRLTAAALGCATLKDLAAEFRRVNPRTTFESGRAYKWLQGRALPRQQQVYADWSALLDLGRPAPGSPTATRTHSSMRSANGTTSRARSCFAGQRRSPAAQAAPGPALPWAATAICAFYVGYSHAWSPYYAGCVIRGTLAITSPLTRGRLLAKYTETLPTARVHVEGSVTASGRSLYLHLREPGSEVPLFLTLFRPAPPASMLAGFLCGATFVGHDPRPSVTRILLVRMPAPEIVVRQGNRYLDLDRVAGGRPQRRRPDGAVVHRAR